MPFGPQPSSSGQLTAIRVALLVLAWLRIAGPITPIVFQSRSGAAASCSIEQLGASTASPRRIVASDAIINALLMCRRTA